MTPSVHWFLASDGSIASSRLHGLLIHQSLRRAGYQSGVLYTPPFWSFCTLASADPFMKPGAIRAGDIVVIQKLDGPEVVRLIDHCNQLGAVTVYVECDWRPDQPAKYRCSHIVCPARYLQRALQSSGSKAPVHYIPDPIEGSMPLPNVRPGGSYTIVWVGSRGNWQSLDGVREILEEPEFQDLKLITISDHPDATYAWEVSTVLRRWAEADVCVIPTGKTPHARSKSNNRLTQAMALGLPVVCGAIPAYADLVTHGVSGFVCDSGEQYRAAFRELRDVVVRQSVAIEGWRLARADFSIDVTVRRWLDLFRRITPGWETAAATRWRDRLIQWSACRRERARVWLQFALIGCPSALLCGRCLIQSQVEWPFQLAPFSAALRKAGRKAGVRSV